MKLSKYSFAGIIAFPLFLISAIPFLVGKQTSEIVVFIMGGLGVSALVFLLLTWFSCRLGVYESRSWLYFMPCTILQLISSFILGVNTFLPFFSVGLLMVAIELTQELKNSARPSFLKFIVPLLTANVAPSVFGFVLVYSGIIKPENIYFMLNSVLPISFFLFIISYTFERFVTKRQKQKDDVIYMNKDDYDEK
ncbi:MAG: hypothetical protein DBX47_02220 [Clostridiales bacterium]|nr:MAG: hypothetical protein DBX47_02220 [Clostridiales bacterium]